MAKREHALRTVKFEKEDNPVGPMRHDEKLAYYITTADGSQRLAYNEADFRPVSGKPETSTIMIDPRVEHQPIFGFGGTFMDSDIYRFTVMDEKHQMEALRALFDPKEGAGWNFMRIPFGSSDWNRDFRFYTYCDIPGLENFSIQEDHERGLIDILRKSLSIRPDLKLLASVWAIPAWMKDNRRIYHGRFDSAYTDVYVEYLCKAVEAYAELGISLHALTFQNEACTAEDRVTPATRITWFQQRDLAVALKKAFKQRGITTEVWIFDHNFIYLPYYPKKVLEDPEGYAATDGVAVHDYAGSPDEMGRLHEQFPEMPIYMTERRLHTIPDMGRILHQLQNYSRSAVQWTTIADEYNGPHQYAGSGRIYDHPAAPEHRLFIYNHLNSPNDWRKGQSWYNFAHFTKFICRGAVRLDSTSGSSSWVRQAAFRNPDGAFVSVAVNETDREQSFVLRCGQGETELALPAMSIMTARWIPGQLTGQGYQPISLAPAFEEPPVTGPDLIVEDILFKGDFKAWSKISISAVLRNAGNAPTPAGTMHKVLFSLDGDDEILWSTTFTGPLQPGESVVLAANAGKGGCRWAAEAGWHTFYAYANHGGAISEINTDNNLFAKDIYISE